MVKRGLEVFVLGRYMVHFGLKAVGRLGFPRISGSGECSPGILSLSLSLSVTECGRSQSKALEKSKGLMNE